MGYGTELWAFGYWHFSLGIGELKGNLTSQPASCEQLYNSMCKPLLKP